VKTIAGVEIENAPKRSLRIRLSAIIVEKREKLILSATGKWGIAVFQTERIAAIRR
jgi:hypothetical protein